MSRFTPPTPRSRRLGRELRKLREARPLRIDDVAKQLRCSPSRISRIESGDIKARPGDVMELLVTYDIPLDGEVGRSLLALARDLRESGWWQRLDALSRRYATFIAYEAEAVELRNFEPTLIPGLLQTEAYAREVNGVGRETETEAIEQRVQARLTRQAVLDRKPKPLRLHAILSEAALAVEVGGPDVLHAQLAHIVELSRRPNVTVQVLRFAAKDGEFDAGQDKVSSSRTTPRSASQSSTTQRIPRSSASTRACGLISCAAKIPATGASSGSRPSRSRYRVSCSTPSISPRRLTSTATATPAASRQSRSTGPIAVGYSRRTSVNPSPSTPGVAAS